VCWSVTKSVTSALSGIAREEGQVGSLHTPILQFFPEYADVAIDGPWKQEMTLEHAGPDGITDTLGGLSLRPRDMARIGHLYLHKGVWQPTRERVISQEWIDASIQRHTQSQSGGGGYGYQWWVLAAEVAGDTIRIP
jgi:CubicO group peptidase (beta-lactamase class C family)